MIDYNIQQLSTSTLKSRDQIHSQYTLKILIKIKSNLEWLLIHLFLISFIEEKLDLQSLDHYRFWVTTHKTTSIHKMISTNNKHWLLEIIRQIRTRMSTRLKSNRWKNFRWRTGTKLEWIVQPNKAHAYWLTYQETKDIRSIHWA